MRAVELTLLAPYYETDSIGQKIKKERKRIIPIVKETSILLEEYYEANQQGIRPTLRVIISSISYNDETEFMYMGERYTVIRASSTNADEIALVGAKKIGDIY